MSDLLDLFSTVSSIIASLTGVLVAILAIKQYRDSKQFDFEANRPFIIPRISTGNIGTERWLFLDIRNVGDTPAKNIRIVFESAGHWHWVANPDYPFLKDAGISAIGPGETLRYFLGVIREGNPISDIETREVFGQVIFDHPTKPHLIIDEFRTSLTEDRYKAKL